MAKPRKSFLLLALSLLLAPVFAEDTIPQVIGPFGGLNNRDNSYTIAADRAQDLLNVDISQGGKSVKKRKGFGTAFTLSIATSPVHGVYNFFDTSGNDISLFFNDTRMSASISGSSPSVIFSTGSNGATYQCSDSLGFAYCVNNSRTALIKTNGVTASTIPGIVSTGTMVAACPTRLAMAGFSSTPSRIDLSADSDFTTWGTGSLGTSGVQITINAPGARITHIVYAFGRLMWFKDTSFGYILIGNQPLQTDWVVKTVAFDVGTNDNTSIYREGILYFRGQDGHIYAFDGSNYQRLSREIAGTIALTQSRASNSWTQTTQSDFQAGATNPAGWISSAVVNGSLVLGTATASTPLTDTDASDFGAGNSLVSVDTITTSGSVSLSFDLSSAGVLTNSQSEFDSSGGAGDCSTSFGQQYAATTTYSLSSVTLKLNKSGAPGNYKLEVWSDSSNTIGTLLATGTVLASSVTASYPSAYTDLNIAVTSTTIHSGSKYWFTLTALGTCDGSNFIASAVKIGAQTLYYKNGASYSQTFKGYFLAFGRGYSSSGSLTSRSLDVGFSTATWLWSWSTFTATGHIPASTTLTYETQTASSTNGVWNTLVSVSSGSSPTSSVQQFIRYKASFATSNTSTSPVLNDITINMSNRLRPNATFYSNVKNASSLTSWDSFQATKQDNGGSHNFAIRSSTNVITVNSSTPSWTALSAGAVPTVSTGTYFQIADFMRVDSYSSLTNTVGPQLDDFTQNWFEGSAADKMYATYFDDKLWFSVTNGTGATTNNKDLVYDLLNQSWTIYDIPSNGFLVRQNRLYFGSASAGIIYKFGDTENDAGSAINAYWKSKDFFGDSPFTDKEFSYLSIAADSVANSSMTVVYTLNGSTSTTLTIPLYSGNSEFAKRNRNLPLGRVGNTFNLRFGNNAADQPFEVFAVQYGIRPRPWAVTNP